MPTLIRFVVLLAFVAALIFGVMVALTIFVEPNQREMSERIPARDLFEQ
jgi:energy-converting hydrogenase Eha subunit A